MNQVYKKRGEIALCFFLLLLNLDVLGAGKNTEVVSWEQSVVLAKRDFQKMQRQKPAAFESVVLKGGMSAKQISVDLAGWNTLILYTQDGGDGNSFDQSVWADARLVDMDGKTVWLDTLKASYENPGYGSVGRNKNAHGGIIKIGGKEYPHGLSVHASGEVHFPLDKKFKKFEAVIGIDDAAADKGSVVFRVNNVSANTCLEELKQQHGDELSTFLFWARVAPEKWLVSGNAEVEKKALLNAINQLDEPVSFMEQVEIIAKNKSVEAQTKGYLGLLRRVSEVLDIQEKLTFFDARAVQLAYENMKKKQGFDATRYEKWIQSFEKKLDEAQKNLYSGDPQVLANLRSILQEAGDMLLDNPVLRDKEIMVTRRHFGNNARRNMSGSLGVAPSNFQNNSEIGNPRKGWDNEFVVLRRQQGNWETKVLYKPEPGVIVSDPEVHFNGGKVLYSSVGENSHWHLFELDLKTGKTKQVTPATYKDFDSFDGCYTPDGKIVFCATATFLGLPCTNGGNKMCGLFVFDPETGKTRQLTYDQDSNWDPVITNNGQVMYQRWEYADLPHSNSRIIFTMNPDGTTQQALYGSNSYFPTALFSARPIPGKGGAFVGVVGGHHSVSRSGRLMVFDPVVGNKEADGVVAEIPRRGEKVLPVVRDRLPDGIWPQFLHPYPLDDTYFLVSAKLTPESLWGLYLVDVFNNMTLISQEEGCALLEPQVLASRPTPPVIPDRVVAGEKNATVYLQDIYFGDGLKGIPRGAVKKLRIASYHFSPVTQGGLLGSIGMDGPWDIKRIVGTVDVEEDGSVMFTVPANVPIFVQPLDAEGKALQLMRSWFTAMPGETLSCLGCHEDRRSVPQPQARLASKKQPQAIKPWYGQERGFSYQHEIQPILDRACVACHNESRPELPYLKGDLWEKGWRSSIGGRAGTEYGGHFTVSYVNLHRYVRRPGIESDMHMLVPMDVHADQTELMRMLNKGHYNVKLSAEEIEHLACWIDFNAPFHGRRQDIPDYDKAKKWLELKNAYAEMLGAPVIDHDYLPELKTGIVAEMPAKLEVQQGEKQLAGWPFFDPSRGVNQAAQAHNRQLGNRLNHQMEIPLSDKISLKLVRIPEGNFLMGSERSADEMPMAKVEIRKPFWMGCFEVTNELYALFDAEHDSRHEHRHGYQFGREGYPMNKPDQPVVRVSWQEAMAFCDWLSKKTGKKFTLPTEAQWEWACRAGSATPFYFGTLGSDFTLYANLGDIRLRDFAACTSFKFYDGAKIIDNPNKYDDWIPRDTVYDDGGFVSEPVGRYRSNPWDLYDMHGNVAEWTRSAYVPYPYQENDGRNGLDAKGMRTTRGGSWYDRPFRTTSSFRQPYREYQKVYNVGFRVIMEE